MCSFESGPMKEKWMKYGYSGASFQIANVPIHSSLSPNREQQENNGASSVSK